MSDDATTPPAENNVALPTERKNRTSMASRATAEGEALLKEMGFEDKETPGRRRTRASIRGDVYTPPAKKGKKAPTPGTGRRGRPPKKTEEKKEPAAEEEEEEEEEEEKKEEEETKKVEKEEETKETNEKAEDKEEEENEAPAETEEPAKETEEATSADGEADGEKEKKKKIRRRRLSEGSAVSHGTNNYLMIHKSTQ
ncbi:cilia- and flagella-associated protein 251-like isoform X1 [Portunus trituberculatus]|uniref:cilia- and flagella-associated protein 251-like isoform X1 n=2 Tax=Portunus trituberculatus TaxID=210409 RepID=UPI001E1CBEAA|nr:cilia- and flagella-associated protein 251-like isoform X1 [Portunus trituberculatus]